LGTVYQGYGWTQCFACPVGAFNEAGDDPAGPDTACMPVFTCEGFAPPMDKTISLKKKNRILPLKMVCFDSDGYELTDADLSAPPILEVDYDGIGPAVPTSEEYLSAGQGDEGNQFSYSGSGWQFNLQTKNFSGSGMYVITVVAGDGSYVIDPTPVAEFVVQ